MASYAKPIQLCPIFDIFNVCLFHFITPFLENYAVLQKESGNANRYMPMHAEACAGSKQHAPKRSASPVVAPILPAKGERTTSRKLQASYSKFG